MILYEKNFKLRITKRFVNVLLMIAIIFFVCINIAVYSVVIDEYINSIVIKLLLVAVCVTITILSAFQMAKYIMEE